MKFKQTKFCLLLAVCIIGIAFTSCRGSSAKKGVELIEKASKVVKKNAKNADDVYRIGKSITSSSTVCAVCDGEGITSYHDCYVCGGDGYVIDDLCLTCNGTGRTNKCSHCRGTGKVSSDD